jgi:DNA invertase Pin-like site-specific DNA recombinase
MHPKITPSDLARQAIVYVRQSTLKQVLENTESTERQYALVDKAIELGWPRAQVLVIDEDQGHSAASSAGRSGFQQLVSAIGLGQIGIVLALEISRCARSQSDWYRVLELAAIFHTLIADEEGLYNPQDHNDRLLLGLKGTLSEAELWTIRARLQGGKWTKARTGELAWSLPIGLLREPDGRVSFDPDQQVQTTMRTILTQFRVLGSASAVLRYFRKHDLRVPCSVPGTAGPAHVVWKTPTYEAIYLILTNPTYAGAYAYGRRKSVLTDPTRTVPARRRTPQEEWAVLIPEIFPAYLSWAEYLENQARVAANRSRFVPGPGAVRQGAALLTGLVVCVRCGRHLATLYNTDPWYTCLRAKRRYGEPQCQSCKAEPIDRTVTELFLQATQPAQVEAALQALDQWEQARQDLERLWQQRLERARYESERAERQFHHVEPENRLVARELENRWNSALTQVQHVERSYVQAQQQQLAPLNESDRALIRRALTDLPQLWHAETTTAAERKRLLRGLIRDVTVDGVSQPGQIIIRVCWQTGATTTVSVRRPRSTDSLTTDAAILEQIRALASDHSDDQIADVLNTQQLMTRRGKPWTYPRVHRVRVHHHIPSCCPIVPRGQTTRGDGLVSVSAAARLFGVSRATIDVWVRHGVLFAQHMPGKNPYWLRVSPAEIARLTAQFSEPGFERLRAATKTLGLTEAQLWEEVRAGRRAIRRMRRDQHWEWQIAVSVPEIRDDRPITFGSSRLGYFVSRPIGEAV